MTPRNKATMSGIPEGLEKSIRKGLRVNLLSVTRLLLSHLTPTLCETVFKRYRGTERERKWSFYAVCLFWAAMIVRQPRSISQGLDQTRKGRGRDKLWPRVLAKPNAFFDKAQGQHPALFMHLYRAFLKSILPQAPQAYASWRSATSETFPESHRRRFPLGFVCRRLKSSAMSFSHPAGMLTSSTICSAASAGDALHPNAAEITSQAQDRWRSSLRAPL